MNKVKFFDKLSILLVIAMALLAFYFNGILPDQVITHWNSAGEPDDWGSKEFHVWFFPLLTIGIYFLFKYLPKMDPKKKNYASFDATYHAFRLLIIAFFVTMFVLTSLINLGYNIDMTQSITLAIGLLFIFIGYLLKDVKQNWFMGIRTPWTMSSEFVWKKTHQMASKIFMMAGFLFLVLPYLPSEFFAYYIIIFVLVIILGTFGYSYWLYKNEKPQK